MSAKISASRKAVFLKALAQSGNVSLSAERARVSRSWVLLHRKSDPAFDAACTAALVEAKARLATGSASRPPSGWGTLDGVELVVRGSGGSGHGRHIQIARARVKQWSPRSEDRFIATLAATCNVRASCAEVGISVPSAYKHRDRWPAFARRWDMAIADGYTRIEIALIEHGGNMFSAPEQPAQATMPPMNVEQAIHVMHMYKNRMRGIGKRPGYWRRPRTLDEVRDSILKKLSAIAAARDLRKADKEADRQTYQGRRFLPPE